MTQPADSWEDLAEGENKAQSLHSIPVNAGSALKPALSSAPATTGTSNPISPTAATATSSAPASAPVSASASASASTAFPDASVAARPVAAAVDDVTEGVDGMALDEEEAKELADAVDEEATVRKVKKPDSERKAHDEREHINIVFIGHVDAGKSTISGQILSVAQTHSAGANTSEHSRQWRCA